MIVRLSYGKVTRIFVGVGNVGAPPLGKIVFPQLSRMRGPPPSVFPEGGDSPAILWGDFPPDTEGPAPPRQNKERGIKKGKTQKKTPRKDNRQKRKTKDKQARRQT